MIVSSDQKLRIGSLYSYTALQMHFLTTFSLTDLKIGSARHGLSQYCKRCKYIGFHGKILVLTRWPAVVGHGLSNRIQRNLSMSALITFHGLCDREHFHAKMRLKTNG